MNNLHSTLKTILVIKQLINTILIDDIELIEADENINDDAIFEQGSGEEEEAVTVIEKVDEEPTGNITPNEVRIFERMMFQMTSNTSLSPTQYEITQNL